MKILFICASSRPTGSTSQYLLEQLRESLVGNHEITTIKTAGMEKKEAAKNIYEQLSLCDAAVIAYSLYVDSPPAPLLAIMEEVEKLNLNKKVIIHSIINCGFYEAHQNRNAIKIMEHWQKSCGFEAGCTLALGAGGIVTAAPAGYGPNANLGKALKTLADDIEMGARGKIHFTHPNFPRFLYSLMASVGWNKAAKNNGLKKVDLYRKSTLN